MLTPETPHSRSRSLRQLRTLACMLAAASLGACAPAGRPDSAPRPITSRIIVRNYSMNQVTLYLARSGGRWRLGQLEAFTDGDFTVPRSAVYFDEFYFVARPLAGRPFRSDAFLFPTGATAVWTIGNHVATSHVALR
ncbi:MAG: hypothetical protein ABR499_06390 [Gemmatimonadaceae bacterium]